MKFSKADAYAVEVNDDTDQDEDGGRQTPGKPFSSFLFDRFTADGKHAYAGYVSCIALFSYQQPTPCASEFSGRHLSSSRCQSSSTCI